jgi:hypothetical protein
MSEAPFSLTGPALYALGYNPIPITPGDKKPGVMIDGEWRLFRGWNQYCVSRPSQFQIDQWAKYPMAGVGAACGQGLICIDIDIEDAVGPLLEILPLSNVQKKGKKGVSLFYRGNTEVIRSKNFRTPERVGLVDLLAEGKQTVLPPSIHPDTGEPYVWLTPDTLLNCPLDDLTELDDDIAEQIAEVLREFGYDPERDRVEERVTAGDIPETSLSNTSDFFRKLNEDALANLHAWVPKLGLPKCRCHFGNNYRAVPDWRSSGSGRPIAQRSPNLSFAKGGIEDFGTGEKFTALNVVMKVMKIGDNERDAAVQWLGANLGYDFGVQIDLRNRKREANDLAKAAERITPLPERIIHVSTPTHAERPLPFRAPIEAEYHKDEVADDGITIKKPVYDPPKRGNLTGILAPAPVADPSSQGEQGPPDDPIPEEMGTDDQPVVAPTREELEEHCAYIPGDGLISEMVDWIAGSSDRPSRPLAIGASLAFLGTLAGRHHEGPTHLRTNLYICGLAESGFGKDHSRDMILELAQKAGLHTNYIGPEDFLSDSALRKSIERRPSLLSVMDELGGFINKIMDRRAGAHQSAIRQMLLKLFTQAKSSYGGTEGAQEQATPIFNPNFSIFGLSTMTDFWPAMSSRGIGDGFLPRWLVITIQGKKPKKVAPTHSRVPPDRLVEWCRAVVNLSRKGNLPDSSARPVVPLQAGWGKDAEACYEWHRELFERRGHAMKNEMSALWTRTMEIALRIAHIIAIGVNPEYPVITEEILLWSIKLVEMSVRSCLVEVADRLASTDKQAEYLKVRRMIKETGKDGISDRKLKAQINGEFDLARLGSILTQLQESGSIERQHKSAASGGRPSWRWVAL